MARYLVDCDPGGTTAGVIVGRSIIGEAPATRHDGSIGSMVTRAGPRCAAPTNVHPRSWLARRATSQ